MNFLPLYICNSKSKIGSCLEYGHSCWGAHGKRSGTNKIYHAKDKAQMELDFQDLNGLSEKNNYDSNEEVVNGVSDNLPINKDLTKEVELDDLVEGPDKNSIKLKKFLYKKLNKSSKNQRNTEIPEQRMSSHAISERWRRLPFYNMRSVQNRQTENNWLNELQHEQQANADDYYI